MIFFFSVRPGTQLQIYSLKQHRFYFEILVKHLKHLSSLTQIDNSSDFTLNSEGLLFWVKSLKYKHLQDWALHLLFWNSLIPDFTL